VLDDTKSKPGARHAPPAQATTAAPDPFDALVSAVAERLRGPHREVVREVVVEVLSENRDPERLLTVGQLAERMQVSERTIRTLRKQGLPTVMVGDSPRFVWADVVASLPKNPRDEHG